MERQKYISLVVELRQIAVAKALTLLDDHDTAEDVAGEVLLRLWEGHRDLHDDADKVKHLANLMARNLSENAQAPIVVTELGMLTLVRLLQKSNA